MSTRRKTLAIAALIASVFMAGSFTSEAGAASSGPVTFTKDVLPILQENCQNCHRPSGSNLSGMVAPMSFMTYKEARPWAKAIARETMARNMPPWGSSDSSPFRRPCED